MTNYATRDYLDAAMAAEIAQSPYVPPARRQPIVEPVVSGIVAAADGIGTFLSGVAAFAVLRATMLASDRNVALVLSLFGALLFVELSHVAHAYRFANLRRAARTMTVTVGAWMACAGAIAALAQLVGPHTVAGRHWLIVWLAGAFAVIVVARLSLRVAMGRWTRVGRLAKYVAVIGAGPIGDRLLRKIGGDEKDSVQIAGVYDDRHRRVPHYCAGHPVRGSVDDLILDARNRRIDTVIVSLPLTADNRVSAIVDKLRQLPIDVTLCPDWFDHRAGGCHMDHVGDVTVLNAAERPLFGWRGIAKGIEDRVLAALILIAISPLLAAIALAIKLDSPGPAFFRQKRLGYNNELIEVFKFRSMYHHKSDANAEQLTRRNDPRVTRLGALLRRTSLDELPQFINVLRGEMSIVGPRPHALAAKAGGKLYHDAVPAYHARHRMKPGITGWAQVNGWRGETETVEQIVKRVEHDLYYIDHWSVLFDLRIILRTLVCGFVDHRAY